jgi:hypothetical protein
VAETKSNVIKIGKIELVFSFLIRALILLAVGGAAINRDWMALFVSSLAFILTFVPWIITKNYRIYFPAEFEIVVLLFIYASVLLGGAQGYYITVWWWDILIHGAAAIALGFIGFILLYMFQEQQKLKAKPLTIAVFSFSFALAVGALWEIFEFSMDSLFGFNMQKTGLGDTMWDLIVDAAGALFTSIIGFIYLKGGKTRLFSRFLKRFVDKNPGLFGNNQ